MTDALCLDDLDPFGTELDDPLEELGQDLYHRLLEAPGSNIDDPARGYGVEGKLSLGLRAEDIRPTIQYGIEAELRKDPRVHQVAAKVTSPAANVFEVSVQIVADEGELGIRLVRDGAGVRRVA